MRSKKQKDGHRYMPIFLPEGTCASRNILAQTRKIDPIRGAKAEQKYSVLDLLFLLRMDPKGPLLSNFVRGETARNKKMGIYRPEVAKLVQSIYKRS